MSKAFRCDGCDRFFGGTPSTISVSNGYSTVGEELTLGHAPGVDDAFPADDPTETVHWPWVTAEIDLCVECMVEYLIEPLQAIAQQGRFSREE